MGPKWLPRGFLELLGLLKASWSGLGGLLESSWTFLLSVAVLIHTVEEDGAWVVLAVGLDKLCSQKTEVHKAEIEVCKACVELHKAYVERLGGSGTHPGCS